MDSKTNLAVLSAALLLTAAAAAMPSAASAQYCYDFQSDATGDYGTPFNRFVGFIDATFSFQNLTATGTTSFEVVSGWGATGNRALEPYGDPVAVKIVPRVGGGSTLPTSFKMDLGAWNGDVDVEAYDASDTLIWSDTFAADNDHAVEIAGVGSIDYVMVFGGDREVFIDNVCIQ